MEDETSVRVALRWEFYTEKNGWREFREMHQQFITRSNDVDTLLSVL